MADYDNSSYDYGDPAYESLNNLAFPMGPGSESDNPSNGTFYNLLSFWMNGVLSLTLVIVGMLGNLAVVVSFHCCGGAVMKQRRRQAFYYYLMTFSMWNTGLLFATVLFNCIPAILNHNSENGMGPDLLHLLNILYLIGYWIGNCCVTADVWLAIVVTVERYLAVARPLRSRLTSPRRRAKLICVLLSALVILYNLPLAFELTFTNHDPEHHASHDRAPDATNGSVEKASGAEEGQWRKLCLSALRDNVYYQFVYRVVAHAIFVSIVPFVIILLLTIKIVLVVRESDRRRAEFRKPTTMSSDFRTAGTTSLIPSVSAPPPMPCHYRYADVLLTVIAVKFLLFYTLPVVINIVELTADPGMFEPEDGIPAKLLLFLVDLANLLVVIDGATNSFFYFSWRSRAKARQSYKRFEGNCGVVPNRGSRCYAGAFGPQSYVPYEGIMLRDLQETDSVPPYQQEGSHYPNIYEYFSFTNACHKVSVATRTGPR